MEMISFFAQGMASEFGCVFEKERYSVCVCVCVWERERERESFKSFARHNADKSCEIGFLASKSQNNSLAFAFQHFKEIQEKFKTMSSYHLKTLRG